MQENWLQLSKAFDNKKEFILASIVATRGSTYRKTGTLMLIDQQGQCTGLLSGGCLEADISLHALEVLTSKTTKLLTYDLQSDDALLWGLGLGCDGAIDILLQPLLIENNHLGFADLLHTIANRQTGYYWQKISDGAAAQAQFIQKALTNDEVSKNKHGLADLQDTHMNDFLVIPVSPPVSLLVCGAGADVGPVVSIAKQMGWQVTLFDHRASFLSQSVFDDCDHKQKIRAENLQLQDLLIMDEFDKNRADCANRAKYDAAIVMTHNLDADGQYLAQLLKANLSYIGLLGPEGRRDKLLARLQLTAQALEGQVYGPAGLALGGRSPQSIALSIISQIQQHISLQLSASCYKAFYRARYD